MEADFPTSHGSDAETWPEPIAELDNHGLEPPEPVVRALEGAKSLSPGQTLAAPVATRTDIPL